MNQPRPIYLIVRLIALCVALFAMGCAMDELESFGDRVEGVNATPQDEYSAMSAAETALNDHDIEGARQIYIEYLDEHPNHGGASVGLAVADLLLVFGTQHATDLLIDNLGASRGLDVNHVLYGEDGYLYWASRGARWEDDGQYQGIRTLLGDDLPWTSEQLSGITAFVQGLDEPVDKLVRKLVTLANALKGVDLSLKAAIEDEEFTRHFIPGEVFHDSQLDLSLGRSELASLRAAIALFQGVVYYVAAYENSWDLQTAFGEWDVHLDDSNFVLDYESHDYMVDYLDGHLFRKVTSTERLDASRTAVRHGFEMAREAIHFGVEETSRTTLTWENITEEEAYAWDQFVAAALGALDGPVELPNRRGATLDLSGYFKESHILDSSIPWFIQEEVVNRDAESIEYSWVLNEEAYQVFVMEGVVDPRLSDDETLDALVPGEGLESFVERLFGAYLDEIDNVYLTTR